MRVMMHPGGSVRSARVVGRCGPRVDTRGTGRRSGVRSYGAAVGAELLLDVPAPECRWGLPHHPIRTN